MKLNYEKDTRIDPNALDVEWLNQAELMRRYASHAAYTKKAMDDAKERLDVGKAQIEMDIRKNPENYGIPKVTEAAIQSTILLQNEYQELSEMFIETKYENDIAIGVVKAIDQKKTALENLVRLLSVAYFAGPQTPRDIAEEWREEIKGKERKEKNTKVKINRKKDKETIKEKK